MKFRWEKKYLYGGITASCVIVFSIMFFVFLNNLTIFTDFFSRVAVILTPFTIAFVMAYLLNPIMKFIESQWIDRLYSTLQKNNPSFELKQYSKIKRSIAITISLIFGFALITSVFVMIIPELSNSIGGIILNLPTYASNVQIFVDKAIESMPWIADHLPEGFYQIEELLPEGITQIEGLLPDDTNQLENYKPQDVKEMNIDIASLISGFLPEFQNILDNVTAGLMGVVTLVKNVFIAVVLTIYLLSSKEMFIAQTRKLLFAILPIKVANSILRTLKHSDKVFGGFIVGKLIDSLIIGVICFIGLTIITIVSPFEMPFILLISTIIGITNIIPFFGPFIGGVPCGVLIFLVDPMATLVFAIFILVLQQIDGNIIGPKILGDSTGLSAFWVMFAILLGGGLFGVAGMLLGVPTFSVCYSILTGFFENILDKKGLSCETSEYYNIEELDETLDNSYYVNYLEEENSDNETVIVIESKNSNSSKTDVDVEVEVVKEKVDTQVKNNKNKKSKNKNKNKK